MDSVKKQTVLDSVPETVHPTISAPAEKGSIDTSQTERQEMTFGLIQEHNRIWMYAEFHTLPIEMFCC